MSNFYDKQGKPISLTEWGQLLQDKDYKIIEKTHLPNGVLVSTVWLGLDHSFNKGKLEIFETMVFPNGVVGLEEDCERYSTLDEARLGHKTMVSKWFDKILKK